MGDYKIKSRIWIESGDKVLLGEGRAQLLKAIDTHGSLSKAAKSLKMSYKKAWTLIDAVNKSAEEPVIETSIGGKEGGGARLTTYGRELVSVFDEINRSCWDFLEGQEQKIMDL